ncbi:opacity protein-like surface antigen [Hasllibacter halocynthiae]|uniref:Opacity protein-like surface antigen n=1 Tax=Hasllibacter halocynthiae TaxID=595589 RepID=A0A2T0X857_9RHOB|nr:outer membrane beta-barrel protein [Hasllibacter halocynthiae]PRY95130.1 opacity protein-like surface antigen [Hasllibacter halocynthiae]
MKKLATATVLSASVAMPALAGGLDQPVIAPVIVPPAPIAYAPQWTGGFIGASVGYIDSDGNLVSVVTDADGGTTEVNDVDLSGDGLTYGLRAGYDYQFRNGAVLGGVLQYDRLDLDIGISDEQVDIDESANSVLRAGLRGGYGAGANLFYLTGGWARLDTDVSGDGDGYFAGLGYERLVTDNVSVGIEALYHEFDDFDNADVEVDATTVGLNVNYRF